MSSVGHGVDVVRTTRLGFELWVVVWGSQVLATYFSETVARQLAHNIQMPEILRRTGTGTGTGTQPGGNTDVRIR